MRHYILRGLLPEPAADAPLFAGQTLTVRQSRISRWTDDGRPLPDEGYRVVLRKPGVGRLSVFVHDVYDALFIVSARSQRKAYALASPFRACVAVYWGNPVDESPYEFLVELKRLPTPRETSRQIAALCADIWQAPVDPVLLGSAIRSGPILRQPEIAKACAFVDRVLLQEKLAWALLHLERSHHLFAGHMTASYYRHHYRHYRMNESAYVREKKYLEGKTRYDLAFLSSFRALESLLGKPQIKKRDIPKLLKKMDGQFGTSFASGRWPSYHEVFSSRRIWWDYKELIGRYLDLRNAVAAHANPAAPLSLREDQVFEIQRLAEHMLYKSAGLSET